jgi:hypothetical protein
VTIQQKGQILSDLVLQIAVLAKTRNELSQSLQAVENALQRARDIKHFVEGA